MRSLMVGFSTQRKHAELVYRMALLVIQLFLIRVKFKNYGKEEKTT
jgi:hypothetical protein